MQTINTEEIIRIQRKGLITIPKKFRDDIGLVEEGLIRLKKERGRLYIEPVRTLPYKVRSYNDRELTDFFKRDDEETKTLKKKKVL